MTTNGVNRSIAEVVVCVAAGQESVRRLPAFRSSKPPSKVYVKGEAFVAACRVGRTRFMPMAYLVSTCRVFTRAPLLC
jgi:hypothetical protein